MQNNEEELRGKNLTIMKLTLKNKGTLKQNIEQKRTQKRSKPRCNIIQIGKSKKKWIKCKQSKKGQSQRRP